MSYYQYDSGGRRGFMSNVPVAIKNIIIINVLVMIMTSLNENFMYEKFALFYPTSPFFFWPPSILVSHWEFATELCLRWCIPAAYESARWQGF